MVAYDGRLRILRSPQAVDVPPNQPYGAVSDARERDSLVIEPVGEVPMRVFAAFQRGAARSAPDRMFSALARPAAADAPLVDHTFGVVNDVDPQEVKP